MGAQEVHQRFVRQDVPGLRRRRFRGERLDVSVWQNDNGDVVHFRLLVAPNRIVDFEWGKGVSTAQATLPDFSKSAGSGGYPESDPTSLEPASLASLAPNRFIDKEAVEAAFQELSIHPPHEQKRVLAFVVQMLYETLSSPHGVLKFVEGKLPNGDDSVLGDEADAPAIRSAAEYKLKYKNVFDRLLSLLAG